LRAAAPDTAKWPYQVWPPAGCGTAWRALAILLGVRGSP
jgi:hypothetical protein